MVNVIDYMPGDTLLHRLNPSSNWASPPPSSSASSCPTPTVALLGFWHSPLRWAPMPASSTVCSRCSSC